MIRSLLIIIMACSLSGCAALNPERGVDENVFYSTAQPKIKIKVSDDYRYLGNNNFEYIPKGGAGTQLVYVSMYWFAKINGNFIERILFIRLDKIKEYGVFWKSKCTLIKNAKYIKIGDKEFCEYSRPVRTSDFINKKWIVEASGKDFVVPNYLLRTGLYWNREGASVSFCIYCAEEIKSYEYHKFAKLLESRELYHIADDQITFSTKFEEKCEQAFQIIKED